VDPRTYMKRDEDGPSYECNHNWHNYGQAIKHRVGSAGSNPSANRARNS